MIGLAEELGNLLASLSFFVFGAVLLGPALSAIDWRIALYALLSLTVVRMVPVAVALAGSRFRLPTVLYVGWFGPRGLASIVFALLLLHDGPPRPNHSWTSSRSPWGSASPCMGRARPGRRAPTGVARDRRRGGPELREGPAEPPAGSGPCGRGEACGTGGHRGRPRTVPRG